MVNCHIESQNMYKI
uniref:Uncharacterized protein n=1 Tax=Lepeophtheirus salmonis TaxID=72036 RepID=A0A0K2SX76_LEPSM